MKEYIKEAVLGMIAIIAYFLLSEIELFPFNALGVDVNSLPSFIKIAYLLIYEVMVISVMLIIFNKKITKDFKDILLNHKEYYSKCMKYWLIGLVVMILSNSLLAIMSDGGIAGNEEALREMFKFSPIYIYLSSIIYAPIVEELVFRQGIRNIFGRNMMFVIISGVVFGGLHVLTSATTTFDLLYLIPYSALGISFAYMLYKTDNIFVSMGFHFMHNGILIAMQFIMLLFS